MANCLKKLVHRAVSLQSHFFHTMLYGIGRYAPRFSTKSIATLIVMEA